MRTLSLVARLASIFAAAFFFVPAHSQTTDVLTWYDSRLPADQFIGINSQVRDGNGAWRRLRLPASAGGSPLPYQPFRSAVNREGRQIYWRKDEINLANSWYGEIYRFDDEFIYLHAETFPIIPADTAWDQRPDRFRLFREYVNSGKGRVLAPRQVSAGWSHAQTLKSYMCGISQVTPGHSRADGWLQAINGQCPLYQLEVRDARVTATIVRNWSAFEAGMDTDISQVPLGPDSRVLRKLPAVWEAALVISQFMPSNGGFMRERFILGWHGGIYYGVIAWDESWGPDFEQQQVRLRAVPEVLMQRVSGPMEFDGMLDRGLRDRSLPPADVPRELTATCIPGTRSALLKWRAVAGQPAVDVRVDDLGDPWQPGVYANDLVINGHPAADSYIFETKPRRSYRFWVHARNESGDGGASRVSEPFAACSGDSLGLPGMPQGAAVSVVGDIATLSWQAVPGATGYDLRVDDQSDPWLPGASWRDVVANNHRSLSYTFRMVPGRRYAWWVHARNAVGTSAATAGPAAAYASP